MRVVVDSSTSSYETWQAIYDATDAAHPLTCNASHSEVTLQAGRSYVIMIAATGREVCCPDDQTLRISLSEVPIFDVETQLPATGRILRDGSVAVDITFRCNYDSATVFNLYLIQTKPRSVSGAARPSRHERHGTALLRPADHTTLCHPAKCRQVHTGQGDARARNGPRVCASLRRWPVRRGQREGGYPAQAIDQSCRHLTTIAPPDTELPQPFLATRPRAVGQARCFSWICTKNCVAFRGRSCGGAQPGSGVG